MAEDSVQTYLTKHKVSSLFEDLMAKIVKELPVDPVEFLIRKLQVLQRQRKKDVPSVSPIKASCGRIQVTGTSAVSKASPNSKSPVSDRLSKSTSGLRPVKPKSSLSTSSMSSLSKTMPTPTKATPTKATPTRPVSSRPATTSGGTSKIPTASGIKSGKVTSRPVSAGTKQPVSTGGKVSTTSRTPNSRTLTLRTPGGKTTPGVKKAPSTSSAVKTPSGKPGPAVSSPAQSMSRPAPAPQKQVPTAKTGPAHMHKDKAKEEEIGEFFGDPKKSSQKLFYADSDDECSDLGVESDGGSDNEEVGVAGHVRTSQANTDLDIQLILASRRCKHTKRSQVKKSPPLHLVDAVADSSAGLCLGYDEDTESGDSDVEVWEDGDALRDEGVEVSRGTPIRKERSSMMPSQQHEVVVCARCAQALGKSDQLLLSGVEFESASQVGSHASYPQWGSEMLGTSAGEQLSYEASERSHETSSDVTLESHDTWGGLAPPPQPQPLISDEESEVHLPPPSLHGHTWEAQTSPQENPHGWGQQTQ